MESVADKKKYARQNNKAESQFKTLMDVHQEMNDAKEVFDAAKNHMVKLLIEEGAYHCFSLNMGALRRTFR